MTNNTRCSKGNTPKPVELDSVVIRFAGDSGDGIQTTGTQFSNEAAVAGNDVSTCPNFPSEIRPPAGSVAGVSGFQINFASYEVGTPGDAPDVLVAFNPAALKANIDEIEPGAIIILNQDAFTPTSLKKAQYDHNPCEDPQFLRSYRVHQVPVSSLTKKALENTELTAAEVLRSKNFFVLGVTLCMFSREIVDTVEWIQKRFATMPLIADANQKALEAGYAYAEATEFFDHSYKVKPAKLQVGTYRNITGTSSMVFALLAASKVSGLELFYGAYPITPATELLQELAKLKHLGVQTFQAEDEIAAICASLGAAFAGKLAVTGSSGPGISLKSEALGLGVITELPLVVINVQRAGPSTGMPTKSEQADLFQAMYGRHGEAPMCVLSVSSPRNAFRMTYEACRIALKYMTPVFLLSEGFTNQTMGPWRIPDIEELPPIVTQRDWNKKFDFSEGFLPYRRDPETLARPWAIPGELEGIHRLGGLEKEVETGHISYFPDNHEKMCRLREEKIAGIASEIPPTEIDGDDSGDLLLIGWGGTEGAIREATRVARSEGKKVSSIHLYYINPLPKDLKQIVSKFKKVMVPENNSGQLRAILRDKLLVDVKGFNRITGELLRVGEIVEAVNQVLEVE